MPCGRRVGVQNNDRHSTTPSHSNQEKCCNDNGHFILLTRMRSQGGQGTEEIDDESVISFEWRERVTTRMFPVSILMSNPLQKPNNSRRACRVVLVASQTENSFPWPPVTSNFPMPAESLLALDCFALPKQ